MRNDTQKAVKAFFTPEKPAVPISTLLGISDLLHLPRSPTDLLHFLLSLPPGAYVVDGDGDGIIVGLEINAGEKCPLLTYTS